MGIWAPIIPITGKNLHKLVDANRVYGGHIPNIFHFFCSAHNLGFWADRSIQPMYHTKSHIGVSVLLSESVLRLVF